MRGKIGFAVHKRGTGPAGCLRHEVIQVFRQAVRPQNFGLSGACDVTIGPGRNRATARHRLQRAAGLHLVSCRRGKTETVESSLPRSL